MEILRPAHRGMCFGVRDAIALALDRTGPEPLTILGDLVHNESVLASLGRSGVKTESRIEAVNTPTVMVTAHGASRKTREEIRRRGLEMVDATCPLVKHSHRAVARLVREGFHPVIIGQVHHVEVRGITEDLREFDVVLSEEDISRMRERPRFGIIAQTTQPIERVRSLVTFLRGRFRRSEARFIDTVCQPTKQRQVSAVELARQSDVVIVIGGANSNNTRELVSTCGKHCDRVHHVKSADELRQEWFGPGDTVGITAGTSTPDEAIDQVEAWLQALCGGVARPYSPASNWMG